ncbi:MAG: hypothetical protein AB8U16_04705 [Rickettsiales endosymbiont of Dermacentor nuttalli]
MHLITIIKVSMIMSKFFKELSIVILCKLIALVIIWGCFFYNKKITISPQKAQIQIFTSYVNTEVWND